MITHVASTGVIGAINEGTVADVAYQGVGDRRLALMFATLKLSTQEFAAVDGWEFLASLPGGSGSEGGVDDAPTRLGAWYRILNGGESGAAQITGTTTPNSIVGIMQTYQTDNPAGWAAPVLVTGTDDVHDPGRSVTATGPLEVTAGDVVVWGLASDTDNAITISGQSISQPGATYAAAAYRSRAASSTGADCGCYGFDAAVIAGSTAAPTVVFDQSAGSPQCGPAIIVRLREASGGPATVDLVPAVLAVAAPSVDPDAGPVTTAVTAAVISLDAAALTAVPGVIDVGLVAAVVTLSAPAVAPTTGGTSVSLTAAVMTLAAPAVAAVPGPVAVGLVSAVVVLSAPAAAAVPGVVDVDLSPAVLVVDAPAVAPVAGVVAVDLAAAVLVLAAVAVEPAVVVPPTYGVMTPAYRPAATSSPAGRRVAAAGPAVRSVATMTGGQR